MHRCLQVPEIVSLICEQLELKQLLNLALTSRRLSQPAVDRIWYELDDFGALFGAMQDLYEVRDVNENGLEAERLKCLRRPLHEKDIRLFEKLASRVRTLNVPVSSLYVGTVSIEMFKAFRNAISSGTEVRPLLPNLQALAITAELSLSVEQVVSITGVISPRLRSFNYLHPYPQHHELDFVKSLSGSHITELILSTPTFHPGCPIPLDVLKSFTNLEHLQVTGFTDEALEVISSFQNLRCLTLNFPWCSTPGTERKLVSGVFPSLSYLQTSCFAKLEDTVFVLDMLDTSPVEQIIIDAQVDSPLKSFVTILDSIEKHVNPQSLWLLDFEVGSSRHIQAIPTETANAFNGALERLCHSFPNLQRIRCQTATTPLVPMSVLKTFSTYLPDLTGLELVGWTPHPTFFGYTSSEVVEIAKMLPNADSLGLPLKLEVIPGAHDPKTRPGQGYSHPYLEYLNVGCSPLHDVYDAVLFLSNVFPALNDIAVDYWNFGNAMDNEGRWKLAGAMLPNFALARTQIDNFWRARVGDADDQEQSALDT